MCWCPGKFEQNFREVIFKLISVTDGWDISCKIAIRWMPLDLTDNKSTLVQVMAWCRQVTSHYLSQCWPRFMSPYRVTRLQWVNLILPQYSGFSTRRVNPVYTSLRKKPSEMEIPSRGRVCQWICHNGFAIGPGSNRSWQHTLIPNAVHLETTAAYLLYDLSSKLICQTCASYMTFRSLTCFWSWLRFCQW